MVNYIVTICGTVAPILSILVFMSPIPTIQKICKDQNVGTLPLLPYSSMIASAFLWVMYGIVQGQNNVVIANVPGFIFGLFYFYYYIKYSSMSSSSSKSTVWSNTLPGTLKIHYIGISIIISIAILVPILVPLLTQSITLAGSIIGMLGVILTISLFASPLVAVQTVIVTRSAKSIPLPFTITTVLNCLLWSIYGLLEVHDRNIYIPNLLGLSFGLVQVLLKLIFYTNDSSSSSSSTTRYDHVTTINDSDSGEIV